MMNCTSPYHFYDKPPGTCLHSNFYTARWYNEMKYLGKWNEMCMKVYFIITWDYFIICFIFSWQYFIIAISFLPGTISLLLFHYCLGLFHSYLVLFHSYLRLFHSCYFILAWNYFILSWDYFI